MKTRIVVIFLIFLLSGCNANSEYESKDNKQGNGGQTTDRYDVKIEKSPPIVRQSLNLEPGDFVLSVDDKKGTVTLYFDKPQAIKPVEFPIVNIKKLTAAYYLFTFEKSPGCIYIGGGAGGGGGGCN